MNDLEYEFEWAVSEHQLWEDIDNEDYCPYCGCELEINFLSMRCPNHNCDFGEVEF